MPVVPQHRLPYNLKTKTNNRPSYTCGPLLQKGDYKAPRSQLTKLLVACSRQNATNAPTGVPTHRSLATNQTRQQAVLQCR